MHAAEAPVAHHENAVARRRVGCRFLYEKIKIGVGVSLITERRERLCLIPADTGPGVAEHLIRVTQRPGSAARMVPIFIVLERGSSTAMRRPLP